MMRALHPMASIRNRLIYILTLVPLAVMMLFATIMYSNTFQIIDKQIYENFQLALETRAADFENMIKTAYKITVELTFYGSAVTEQLDSMLISRDVAERARLHGYIERTLTAHAFSSPEIGMIALIDSAGNTVLVSTDIISTAEFEMVFSPLTSWRRATIYRPHRSMSRFHSRNIIAMSRTFQTKLHDRCFTVYIESSNRYLDQLLDPAYRIGDVTLYMNKALLDSEGMILHSSDANLLPVGEIFQDIIEAGRLGSYHPLLIECDGWGLAGIVSDNYYHGIYAPLVLQTSLTIIACLGFLLLLAISIWRLVYSPIHAFAAEIRSMKPASLYVPRADAAEINEFRAQFNQMRSDIWRLVAQTEAEAQKNATLENELLLSRINPHFLHNTLDNIKWLARKNGQNEVAEMLATLNGLIYYNLGKQSFTTLKDELTAVDNYLFLQKRIRPLEYRKVVEVSEDALDMPAPFYILQPLVENSLRHAYREGLVLTVVLTEVNQWLYIKIRDNGAGMNEATLAHLRAMAHAMQPDSTGIGLNYVFRALRLMYGKSVRIEIESELGVGSIFTIAIERSVNA